MSERRQVARWVHATVMAFAAVLARSAGAQEPPFHVEVDSQFGDESKWMEAFVADAGRALIDLMAAPDVKPPAVLRVQLRKDAKAAGVGGWATPDGIGCSSNTWPRDRYRLWIVAHELSNQFAAVYAGSGGFPSDWWANGRSPFPAYASSLVLRATGNAEAAEWIRSANAGKPDHELFWKLHERHGYALFSRFFALLRADRVDLGAIGTPWPAPDRARSAYAIAYLSAAAGTNLAPLLREHGIGRMPTDWPQRHPEIAFVEYEVTPADVDAVLAAREWLFGKGADAAHHEALRVAFRRGGVMEAAATVSPPRFRIESGFGGESDWVQGFLGGAATALIRAISGDDRDPPRAMDVQLTKDPNLGGIAGGPDGAALRYVSNAWPQENFRLWILSRDLTRVFVDHYGGGGIPAEVVTPEALADVLAVALLRGTSHAAAADWLVQIASSEAHARARGLLGATPLERLGKFLRLLRDDRVDLSSVAADRRAQYAVAYLSLAANENLGAAAGVDAARVKALMDQRNRLFTKPASEDARARFRRGE